VLKFGESESRFGLCVFKFGPCVVVLVCLMHVVAVIVLCAYGVRG